MRDALTTIILVLGLAVSTCIAPPAYADTPGPDSSGRQLILLLDTAPFVRLISLDSPDGVPTGWYDVTITYDATWPGATLVQSFTGSEVTWIGSIEETYSFTPAQRPLSFVGETSATVDGRTVYHGTFHLHLYTGNPGTYTQKVVLFFALDGSSYETNQVTDVLVTQ